MYVCRGLPPAVLTAFRASSQAEPPHPPESRRLGPVGYRPLPIGYYPPHPPRNRGDCGPQPRPQRPMSRPASRPPEPRQLWLSAFCFPNFCFSGPTPPGIAATAASINPSIHESNLAAPGSPESRRPRLFAFYFPNFCFSPSRPPESRRLRPLAEWRADKGLVPPHAPRNRGDCGHPMVSPWTGQLVRLTPPGIAATLAFCFLLSQFLFFRSHAPRNRGACGLGQTCRSTSSCPSGTMRPR